MVFFSKKALGLDLQLYLVHIAFFNMNRKVKNDKMFHLYIECIVRFVWKFYF